MRKVTLHINNDYESHVVELNDELSIGRSDLAQLVLEDSGLSRLNTTIFRDGDEVLIVDENSTNGTFVNKQRISGAPRPLNASDEITLGNNTNIYVEIADEGFQPLKTIAPKDVLEVPVVNSLPDLQPVQTQEDKSIPTVLIAAAAMFFFIIIGTVAAILLINPGSSSNKFKTENTPSPVRSGLLIPIVIRDPLGGEDPDDLEDIIASLEGVEETTLDTNNVDEVKATTTSSGVKEAELAVPLAFWQKQRDLALGSRNAATGLDPGLRFFPELVGGNVIKQKLKLGEMIKGGYKQPMDFSDLAEKRLSGDLIELPIATEWYMLDVGGSASEEPFKSFSFELGTPPVALGSAKYKPLEELAKSFKSDLNNGRDRRQIRMRLLRMFHRNAKPILEELAKAYHQKFGRPLRVTSLTRSMDYQIGLNKINPNSFNVRGPGSLPPHTSGCAFDLARKHMTADEQNFIQEKLTEMEKRGVLDALREGGANACFHVFIYPDGRAPKV